MAKWKKWFNKAVTFLVPAGVAVLFWQQPHLLPFLPTWIHYIVAVVLGVGAVLAVMKK